MKTLGKNLWSNENGFILSAELVIILTVAVLGTIVGLSHVATAVNRELNDVSAAIMHLNQSYQFTGYRCCRMWGGFSTASTAGSAFLDWNANCMANCGIFPVGSSGGSNAWGGGYCEVVGGGSLPSGGIAIPATQPTTVPCPTCPPGTDHGTSPPHPTPDPSIDQ